MSVRRIPVPVLDVHGARMCRCTSGGACSVFAPGHAMHLIQARLASASPLEWTDAVVEALDAGSGDVVLRTLEGAIMHVWNRAAAHALPVGAPVALHDRYHVLADGRRLFNAAVV